MSDTVSPTPPAPPPSRPVRKPVNRALAAVGTAILVLAAVAALLNELRRRDRVLHVVNGLTSEVTVSVDGGEGLKISALGGAAIPFTEGRHRITVTGAVTEEHDVEMTTPYFSRWFGRPVWILNVARAAPVVSYTLMPSGGPGGPRIDGVTILYRQPVSMLEDVETAFQSQPDQPAVSGEGGGSTPKRHVEVAGSWHQAISMLYSSGRRQDAMDALQWCAQQGLGGDSVGKLHLDLAMQMDRLAEALQALQPSLERLPLNVELHRMVQDMDGSADRLRALSAQYEAVLKENPSDAGALYLSGRLARDPKDAEARFLKAREADPASPWPMLALGFGHAGRAEWPQAAELMGQFVKVRPQDAAGWDLWFDCELGAGRLEELETSLNARSRSQSLREAEQVTSHLVMLHGSKNEPDKAKAGMQRLTEHGKVLIGNQYRPSPYLEIMLGYASGNMEGVLGVAKKAGKGGAPWVFIALCEQRKLEEAAALLGSGEFEPTPLEYLSLAVVADLEKNAEEAKRWREAAIKRCETSETGKHDFLAALLKLEVLPSLDPVLQVPMAPRDKALVCVALASVHPERKAELLELARRLNVVPAFPHHLVRSVTNG